MSLILQGIDVNWDLIISSVKVGTASWLYLLKSSGLHVRKVPANSCGTVDEHRIARYVVEASHIVRCRNAVVYPIPGLAMCCV